MLEAALLLVRMRVSLIVVLNDPAVLGAGRAFARECEPRQAARGKMRKSRLPGEQHVAEQRLRLVMALVRRERQPTRALTRIIELALARKIKPREPILRVGIAEIGGGVGIHIARALDIGLHVGIRDAALIVGADRDESVGNETRLRTVRRDVGVVGSELREIVKRLERS